MIELVDERRDPMVIGGILPCDIDISSRHVQPYWCSTHAVNFTRRGVRDAGESRDYCPVARLEAWKARRGNRAELAGVV